tara:strand:- start:327 stop:662 length:336 start_codon:yes stop_codon:yes gene_type:complete
MCEEYNGWKNRQTWLVNLWLNNKPSSQQALYDIANDNDDGLADGSPTPVHMRADTLMEYIMDRFHNVENFLTEDLDSNLSGMFLDLINDGIWMADLESIVAGAVDNYVETA